MHLRTLASSFMPAFRSFVLPSLSYIIDPFIRPLTTELTADRRGIHTFHFLPLVFEEARLEHLFFFSFESLKGEDPTVVNNPHKSTHGASAGVTNHIYSVVVRAT